MPLEPLNTVLKLTDKKSGIPKILTLLKVLELIKVSQQKAGYQSFVDDKDDDSNSDKDEKDDDFNSPCNGGVDLAGPV